MNETTPELPKGAIPEHIEARIQAAMPPSSVTLPTAPSSAVRSNRFYLAASPPDDDHPDDHIAPPSRTLSEQAVYLALKRGGLLSDDESEGEWEEDVRLMQRLAADDANHDASVADMDEPMTASTMPSTAGTACQTADTIGSTMETDHTDEGENADEWEAMKARASSGELARPPFHRHPRGKHGSNSSDEVVTFT